jgi:predicted Zn-dependent protease
VEEPILKKLTITLCLALATLLFAGVMPAKSITKPIAPVTQENRIFTHKEAGVQFEVPKGWKAKPDGEVITVSTADDSLQMVFWVPDENTFDAAVKDIDSELGKTIKNIKTTDKGTSDTHNGMPHFSEGGTGEVNGTTIEWNVDVLAAKKVVIILTFAAPGIAEKHAEEAAKFISSIKKVA